MIQVNVCDLTLRECAELQDKPGFREKIEIARLLDGTGVDVIETGLFSGSRADALFLHTISPIVKNAAVSCRVKPDRESVRETWDAVRKAARPRLSVAVPVSTVQMEYICHKKPASVLELIAELVGEASSLCGEVEFAAIDATRADRAFLIKAVATALNAGASSVCICDSEGSLLPSEVPALFADIKKAAGIEGRMLSAEFSNTSGLGVACAVSSLREGVTQIKTAVGISRLPSLEAVASVFRSKEDALGCRTRLNHTVLNHSCRSIASMLQSSRTVLKAPLSEQVPPEEDYKLNREDDFRTVSAAVTKLGYDLSAEDMAKVFEDFSRLSQKKTIGRRELEAIVAGSTMQYAPVYKLKSFVVTTGNLFSSEAQVCLEKDGRMLHGISLGDGPIDASFRAIESVIGHHFELDDFQIRAVTEGREAMGEAIVKLRKGGKLYSGIGLSTDIIGSSIHAYVSALNKIMSEED